MSCEHKNTIKGILGDLFGHPDPSSYARLSKQRWCLDCENTVNFMATPSMPPNPKPPKPKKGK